MYGQKQLFLATTLVFSALFTLEACAPKSSNTNRLSPEARAKLLAGAHTGPTGGAQIGGSQNGPTINKDGTLSLDQTKTGKCHIAVPASQIPSGYESSLACDSIAVTKDASGAVAALTQRADLDEQNAPHVFTQSDAQTISGGTEYAFGDDGSTNIIPLTYQLPILKTKLDTSKLTVGYTEGTGSIANLTVTQQYTVITKMVGAQAMAAISIAPEVIRNTNFAILISIGTTKAVPVVNSVPTPVPVNAGNKAPSAADQKAAADKAAADKAAADKAAADQKTLADAKALLDAQAAQQTALAATQAAAQAAAAKLAADPAAQSAGTSDAAVADAANKAITDAAAQAQAAAAASAAATGK